MRRVLVVVATTVVVLGLAPTPSSAGGSWIVLEDRTYVPGEIVTATAGFSVNGTGARIREGPFFAYLFPSGRYIDPPRIPPTAIRLGQLRIARTESWFLARASLTFEVPTVAPGRYHISLCNDPCRDAVVGDLIGSLGFWIGVGGDPDLQRAADQLQEMSLRVERASARRDAALRRRIVLLEGKTLTQGWALERAEGENEDLRSRIEELEGRLDSMQRAAETTPPHPAPLWPFALAVGLALGATVLAGLAVRRARPHPAPMVRTAERPVWEAPEGDREREPALR